MSAALGDLRNSLRWLNPAGRVALVLLVLLAVTVGGFSWQVRPFSGIERELYDLRAALFREKVAQDPRVVLVVYTAETVRATGQQSPLDRSVLVRALAELDRAGAKAIGLDIVFDQPQPEDAALIAQLRAMRTPVYFAAIASDATARRTEYARNFARAAGIDPARRFSTTIAADDDQVVRRWPALADGHPPPLASALSGGSLSGYEGPIRFRLPVRADEAVLAKLPIDLFADKSVAAILASEVAGRIVLVGTDLSDFDQYKTPLVYDGLNGTISALEIQGQMLTVVGRADRRAPEPDHRVAGELVDSPPVREDHMGDALEVVVEVVSLNGFYDAVLRGESSALEAMSAWAAEHPGDVAMASLLRRLRTDEATSPTSL